MSVYWHGLVCLCGSIFATQTCCAWLTAVGEDSKAFGDITLVYGGGEMQGDLSASLLPLLLKFLVMSFLATRLRMLDLSVLPLEATSLLLVPHLLLDEILGPILSVDATRIPFCWPLNYGADL